MELPVTQHGSFNTNREEAVVLPFPGVFDVLNEVLGGSAPSDFAMEISRAEDNERQRIAEDLHDCLGQNIAALSLNLQLLNGNNLPPDQANILTRSLALVRQLSQDIRTFTFELCPPTLYEQGISAALAHLVENFRKRYSPHIQYHDDSRPKNMPPGKAAFLYRSVRELLINAVKHGKADNITIITRTVGHHVEAEVEDDGMGFDSSFELSRSEKTGFGLFSISRRLKNFGGRLDIDSAPKRGTKIKIRLPIAAKAGRGEFSKL